MRELEKRRQAEADKREREERRKLEAEKKREEELAKKKQEQANYDQHRLRPQAHMAHHRHAALGKIGDGRGHLRTGFQLHRAGAGLLERDQEGGVTLV